MAITLPQQNPKILIVKAIEYMKKLNMDTNSINDINYAISFVTSAIKMCPDAGKGYTGIEISFHGQNLNEKIDLTVDTKRSAEQILDGLRLLKNRIK